MNDERQGFNDPPQESGTGPSSPEGAQPPSPGLKLPFDPLRLVRALLRRWFWPFVPPIILGPIGIGIGLLLFKTGYTSEVQLIRREMESGFRVNQFGSAFKPGELTAETLVPLMHSVGLLTRVGSMIDPPMTGKELFGCLTVTPERRTDLIRIALSTKRGAAASVEMANIYAKEVVKLTVDLQQQEATEINRFFSEELANLNSQLNLVNKEILQFSRDETFIDGDKETEAYLRDLGTVEMNLQNARIENQTLQYKVKSLREALRKHNPIATELKSAQENLTTLLVQYTDENPLVVEQRQHIASLEKQLESFAKTESDDAAYTGGQLSDAIYLDLVKWKSDADSLVNRIASLEAMRDNLKLKLEEIPGKNLNYLRLQSRKTTLTEMRDLIAARQTEAQVYQESALGYYRLFSETTEDSVLVSGRGKKVLIAGLGLAGLGFGAAFLLVLLLELIDQRIITAGDVTRVTGRRLIGRLDDCKHPSEGELEDWALKQIRKISDSLQLKQDGNHEIGFLSAGPGEGKTTIIHALAHAAALRGRPVVTLTDARPSAASIRTIPLEEALKNPQAIETQLAQIPPSEPHWIAIQLPTEWKWNLERRQQWVQAIGRWRTIPKGTILVEVPPQFSSDGILYAETLKHTLWVSSSGIQTASQVSEIISSLDHSHCQLSGAIINREPPLLSGIPFFSRWIRTASLIALASFATNTHAAASSNPEAVSQTNPVLAAPPSAAQPTAARWQQRLTLGPGDTINIGLYGYPNHFRQGVIVSPDGFVSYLQARNVQAKDRTVDELRAALDEALSRYFRSPRTMVMPREFLSKKYHIMGSVKRSGTYVLNRPVTIIEAVAQAEGMRTGLFDHNTIELADLERSFLARGDKRMDVDFKALFHQGDLSQNVLLEPNDYIYIPSSSANEVYILGAVTRPGAVGITTNATVMRLVAVRGGFLRTAYKDRILIIRGSWIKPETFVFNAKDVLNGKGPDFVLRPKDVIFVSERPWAKAEELLDLAARSFLQSATATWTGESVGPLIREAIVK